MLTTIKNIILYINEISSCLDITVIVSVLLIVITFCKRIEISNIFFEKFKYIKWVRFFILGCALLLLSDFTLFLLFGDDSSKILLKLLSLIFGTISLTLMTLDRERTTILNYSIGMFMLSPILLVIFPQILNVIDIHFTGTIWTKANPSLVVKGLYYYIGSYSCLRYVGEIYVLNITREREAKKLLVNIEGLSKSFQVLSFALAFLIALFLSSANVKYVGLVAGAIGVGISISLKELLTNFISGVLLMWDDSIKQDDVISVENYITKTGEVPYGWISKITMRYTIIKDRNEINLLIPNSVLINNPIINWTHDGNNVRITLDISVAYSAILEMAILIMKNVCRNEERVLKDPPPRVNIMRCADSGIDLQLRFYIKDPKRGIRNIKSALYKSIIKEFDKGSIEIPFPQRDIHIIPPK